MHELPLAEELLHWKKGKPTELSPFTLTNLVQSIASTAGKDLQGILRTQMSVILDDSQLKSLCACFMQRVSLVQGPPGKSTLAS